jgi:hypothetical protein
VDFDADTKLENDSPQIKKETIDKPFLLTNKLQKIQKMLFEEIDLDKIDDDQEASPEEAEQRCIIEDILIQEQVMMPRRRQSSESDEHNRDSQSNDFEFSDSKFDKVELL